MKNKAFTLVEMITSIVILGILSAGIFVSIKHLYLRAAKTKALSELSLDSQIILDQISSLLYDRVPSSVIGYDYNITTGISSFSSIYDLNDSFRVLEWIGTASEALKARKYSGFVDMDKSDRNISTKVSTIVSYDIRVTELNTTEYNKFGISYDYENLNDENVTALIFAGAFDDGSMLSDFNNSFGWHGYKHSLINDITKIKNDNITLPLIPDEIYEKYYLVDSAYAIARGEDIDLTATCINDLNQSNKNNTLFLFYNYRPWKNQTFCADFSGANKEGNVTILSKEARGFDVGLINDSLYFNLTLERHIRGSENNVTISKQKVVF